MYGHTLATPAQPLWPNALLLRSPGRTRPGAYAAGPVGSDASRISCAPSLCLQAKAKRVKTASGQFGVSFNVLLLGQWLHDADPPLAPLRRSRPGSNMPIRGWILDADHPVAPICRSVTRPGKAEIDLREQRKVCCLNAYELIRRPCKIHFKPATGTDLSFAVGCGRGFRPISATNPPNHSPATGATKGPGLS